MSEIQDQVAFRIRAELVCCTVYDDVQADAARLDAQGAPDPVQAAIGNAIIAKKWHDLCYWGEAAAQIAEGRCPGHETKPNICQCDCYGCQHGCGAHQEGPSATG